MNARSRRERQEPAAEPRGIGREPTASEDVHGHALAAGRLALEKKAENVVVLDLRELTSICDYFVLADGDSEPQIKAIVDRVEEGLRERGQEPWHVEGKSNRTWVVLDYVDFVVHVFRRSARENYMLERLWGDAPREVVELGTDRP